MAFIKKTGLFLFAIFLSIQFVAAQTNWKLNRGKGSGDLVAVFFTSAEKGWIAGDNGYLAWTGDGGRNWTKQEIGTTENINEIYFRNDDNGYLVAGKKMFITRDAGRTWRETQIYRTGEFGRNSPDFLS
ncbi:MAG TPA: YCF48-related protein, partial [Pyrinomonadaceae bacterium]|nr:YCF48-related protein [Pyrinomonadaceae bacterium]